MRNKFLFGLFITSIYYVVGYLIVILLNSKLNYRSTVGGPGLDFLVGALFLLGGLIWLIICIIKFFSERKNLFIKGSLMINVAIFLFIIISFYITSLTENIHYQNEPSKTYSIDQGKDFKIVTNNDGDTLFLELKDSVIINKLDK